jgi:hypothetical protein
MQYMGGKGGGREVLCIYLDSDATSKEVVIPRKLYK